MLRPVFLPEWEFFIHFARLKALFMPVLGWFHPLSLAIACFRHEDLGFPAGMSEGQRLFLLFDMTGVAGPVVPRVAEPVITLQVQRCA